MFRILFTPEAAGDLRALPAFERRKVVAAIDSKLTRQALDETRNRKRLRPNPLSEWELRVGSHRVFYDVSEEDGVVSIVAVGAKKGEKLFLRGREFDMSAPDDSDDRDSGRTPDDSRMNGHEDRDDSGGE